MVSLLLVWGYNSLFDSKRSKRIIRGGGGGVAVQDNSFNSQVKFVRKTI